MKNDKNETIYEIADLCYHTLVLMVAGGISIADITKELAERKIINKKIKQEKMK
jgi:phosphoribosyl-ATP pyrophosphohydrolase/phosphoribosyl-AMP cyclohydrolase